MRRISFFSTLILMLSFTAAHAAGPIVTLAACNINWTANSELQGVTSYTFHWGNDSTTTGLVAGDPGTNVLLADANCSPPGDTACTATCAAAGLTDLGVAEGQAYVTTSATNLIGTGPAVDPPAPFALLKSAPSAPAGITLTP